MIEAKDFVRWLDEEGVNFFAGVPDSLLKEFGTYVHQELPPERHLIAANEGNAVAVAMGYHLRTGSTPLVYLQNSGIGNTVNPLLSLVDPDVYAIPMVLLVGWRGQPGVKDEPQHVKQGRVMTTMLDGMDINWTVVPTDAVEARQLVVEAIQDARERLAPHVLLVEKGTFASVSTLSKSVVDFPTREEVVVEVATAIGTGVPIVSTTGMLSRELFEYRAQNGLDGSFDFLTVGGMGHASSIALGIGLAAPDDEVWCLDGDGALLMHMGSLGVAGDHAPRKYFHVVFNNEVHDSVGGQPTSITAVDIPALASSCGYVWTGRCETVSEVRSLIESMRAAGGPSLLEVRVRPGSRSDLGRPTRTPRESRAAFMTALGTE